MDGNPRIEGYDEVLTQLEQFASGATPFDALLGLVWDLLSPERVEAHLPVTEKLHQPYGLVHGGVYASIVESVGSVAGALRVIGDGRAVVGVHNSTDFVRSTRDGTIHAVATPIHVGRTQHLWLVECRDDDDRLLARGQLRAQVLDAARVQ